MIERRVDPGGQAWRLISDRAPSTSVADCPFCPTQPGRPATRVPRPSFEVAVIDDETAPLDPNPPNPSTPVGPPYRSAPAVGAAEIVVYSDDHEATHATLGRERMELLLDVWAHRYAELGARPEIAYVYVFEAVDATHSHPHGHIHAYPEIPPRILRRLEQARSHLEADGTCILCDVVAREQADGVRVVAQTESFIAFVPFAPRFSTELQILSRRHASSLLDLTDPERSSLAELLEHVFRLPYAIGFHQAPTDDGAWQSVSHFQMELAPPTGATGAGSALGAGVFTVDRRPEDAAADLRAALAS